MKQHKQAELKPLFLERMNKLLSDKKDFESYLEILKVPPVRSIRCNTLKITPEDLKKRLENNGWKIKQLWKDYPEVMIIEGKFADKSVVKNNDNLKKRGDNNISVGVGGEQVHEIIPKRVGLREGGDGGGIIINLEPGELGNSLEHLLGYYYIQELASMLPVLVLNPEKNQIVLDLCASPGSKTTQMSAFMENTGTIIANEISLGRIKILANNLERCGVANAIITKKEGSALCRRLLKQNIISREPNSKESLIKRNFGPLYFDKILVDAPCSGEGTIRSTPKTPLMWNINTVKNLSKMQKNLVASAISLLKKGGELVYSTCTHAPEENEEIVDFILKSFPDMKIEKIVLPIQSKPGIKIWQDKEYLEDVKFACRVYPHVADTEGFFVAKFKKIR